MSDLIVVQNGSIMDPFYRNSNESPHPKSGRKQHLGSDITGPTDGDGSISDPRRGLPVYAAIKTKIPLDDLNSVKAYNKSNSTSIDGLSIPGNGDASMIESRIALQPWIPEDDNSYGGVVGMSCIYSYNNSIGGTSELTLFIEFLHLITADYLPKDKSGRIAGSDEWNDTGRGIGYGPTLKNGLSVTPEYFVGPGFPLVGYLGASQTPHVHIQAAFFNHKTYSMKAVVRLDPMVAIF